MHSATGKPEEASNLRSRLCALPKVDLHRHLEGSLRLQTLAEIAQEHGIDLPSYDIEVLRPFVTAADEEPDFHRFLEKFRFLRRFYPTQEAVERIAYEAVADAAEDNVRYLELRFNPIAQARGQGFSLDEVTTWICGAVDKAQCEVDICVNLIVQIGRDESPDTAWQVAEVAVAHRHRGVVGLDLAGDEVRYPAGGFAKVFQWARREGLHITVHAGEATGAHSVREAIELLGAQRIGHGIRTVEDSDVVRLVHERGITLEVCPTSNLQTGVVRRLVDHPLVDLLALGLRTTVNTDDPSVSDTTLTDEYEVAIVAMGLTLDHIKRAIVTAAEGSFQSPEQKEHMVKWFREALKSGNGGLSGLTSREVNDSVDL